MNVMSGAPSTAHAAGATRFAEGAPLHLLYLALLIHAHALASARYRLASFEVRRNSSSNSRMHILTVLINTQS